MNALVTQDTPQVPRLFSISQRIGRLRYFVYILSSMVGCAVLLVLIYLFALLLPVATGKLVSGIAFILVKNLLIPMLVLMLTMRRVRDFDFSGWWALTILIPFVTIVFLFIPGSKQANRFGPPPAPNHPGLRFVAIALPIALLAMYYGMYSSKGIDGTAPVAVPGIKSAPTGQGLKAY